jgi:uncharacterized membrane protein YhiD involved in acid resistance
MDPLSITASIATLLGAAIGIGVALRKFLIGAAETQTVVLAMIADVKALRTVLQSMEETFEVMNSDQTRTDHIGTHWKNLHQSLEDGAKSLARLQSILDGANKDVKILDNLRRQARDKTVSDQISSARQEMQSYKDALQLSLQTVLL